MLQNNFDKHKVWIKMASLKNQTWHYIISQNKLHVGILILNIYKKIFWKYFLLLLLMLSYIFKYITNGN